MGKGRQNNPFTTQFALAAAARHIETMLKAGLVNRNKVGDVTFQPAVTQILINLNDLLQAASAAGKRVTFADDVRFVFGSPQDVTTLINDARNAACHINSENRNVGATRLGFTTVNGRIPQAVEVGDGVIIGCDYEDDWVFAYGPLAVYVRRHLVRAFEEAVAALDLAGD